MYSEKGHCNYLEIEKIEKKKKIRILIWDDNHWGGIGGYKIEIGRKR